MLFNSLEFLVFFPLVVLIYFMLPHRYRWIHLLVASCYFYAAFVPFYLAIAFSIIVINYAAGLLIEKRSRSQLSILILAISVNVIILCVFKYYYFFVADLNALFQGAFPLKILFPLGLSFQIFQVLSYLIEVKRGDFKAERHFGLFALSILFFPKLIAGPIERPQGFLSQLHEEKSFNFQRLILGLKIMLWGFFKKLVIADRLAIFVDEVYLYNEAVGSPAVWIAVVIFFPIQLYCDFSGYTSIAVGAAKIFGYDLIDNFRRPFMSLTLAEFWNRWHISLSTWLRDYLYQPLVIFFRQYGKWAVVFGLIVTFLISGIWHGAGWNFLIYGIFQGIIIAVEFLLGIKSVRLAKSRFKKWSGRLTTFFLWALTLIFFRAVDLTQSMEVLAKLFWEFDLSFALPGSIPRLTYVLAFLSIFFLFYFENRQLDLWLNKKISIHREVVLSSSLATAMITLGVYHNLSFIYFKF